jgi:haloacetate dehalogenase
MFEDFAAEIVDVGDTTIFLRRAGSGPPLLLLHGFPQTHLMWWQIAPATLRSFVPTCGDTGAAAAQPQHRITRPMRNARWLPT